MDETDAVLLSLRSKRGILSQIARECGLTRQAVIQWRRVPAERVLTVARVVGVDPSAIRPDLYPASQ